MNARIKVLLFVCFSVLGHFGLLAMVLPKQSSAEMSWEQGETSLLVNLAEPSSPSVEPAQEEPIEEVKPEPIAEPVEPVIEQAEVEPESEPEPEPELLTAKEPTAETVEETAPPKPPTQPVEKKPEPVKKEIVRTKAEYNNASTASSRRAATTRSKARAVRNPAPPYPKSAIKRNRQGRVVLRVSVSASGHPTSVSVSRSSGYSPFDQSAINTVKRSWRFVPATLGGRAVASIEYVTINFRLR